MTANNTLLAMWPLVHAAGQGILSDLEKIELRRLCTLLQSDLLGMPAYNEAVDGLCRAIRSSGLLELHEKPAGAISLKIDQLWEMLKQA